MTDLPEVCGQGMAKQDFEPGQCGPNCRGVALPYLGGQSRSGVAHSTISFLCPGTHLASTHWYLCPLIQVLEGQTAQGLVSGSARQINVCTHIKQLTQDHHPPHIYNSPDWCPESSAWRISSVLLTTPQLNVSQSHFLPKYLCSQSFISLSITIKILRALYTNCELKM